MPVRVDWTDPDFARFRHGVLSEVMAGELLSMETSAAMIAFAPSVQAKLFLAAQAADEARHAVLFQTRLHELGATALEPSAAMQRVMAFLADAARSREWLRCLVAQNLVLEGVATILFETLAQIADPHTARLLEPVNADELKHVRFGVTSLQKLRDSPGFRRRVLDVQNALLPLMADILASQVRLREADHEIDYRAIGERAVAALTARLSALGIELSMWDRAKLTVWRWIG